MWMTRLPVCQHHVRPNGCAGALSRPVPSDTAVRRLQGSSEELRIYSVCHNRRLACSGPSRDDLAPSGARHPWLPPVFQGAYQDARAKGVVDMDGFLQCIYRAIEEVLQARSWCRAFEQNGFGALQANLSNPVQRTLKLDESPLAVPTGRPQLADVEMCFPKKLAVPASVLVRMAGGGPALGVPAAGSVSQPVAEGIVTRFMAAAACGPCPPARPPIIVAHRLLPRRYIPR